MKSLIIAALVAVSSLAAFADTAEASGGQFIRRHPVVFPRAAFISRGGIPTFRSTAFPLVALRRQSLGFPQVVGFRRQAFFTPVAFRQNVFAQNFFVHQPFVAFRQQAVFVPRQTFFVQQPVFYQQPVVFSHSHQSLMFAY